MLDGVSLDQLRTFIAAADEGSFSAAGRRLRRAQSVVSQTLANLEGQLGVKLFDRSARFPVLTDHGRALLADARAVAGNVDLFKARAKSFADGLEPELNVAVDVMFPSAPLTAAVIAFQQKFPSTLLNFDVESSAVVEPVLNGRCDVGVVGSWSIAPPQLTYEPLLTVRVPYVVSSQHPLAKHRGPIPAAVSTKHVFLTHVDPADISQSQGFMLMPTRLWRLSHLETKLAFLRAGLGYAGIPLHMIEADLTSGALVQIRLEGRPAGGHAIAMSAIYRPENPPGPAGRWFIDYLKQEYPMCPKEKAVALPPTTAKRQSSSSRRSPAKRKRPGH